MRNTTSQRVRLAFVTACALSLGACSAVGTTAPLVDTTLVISDIAVPATVGPNATLPIDVTFQLSGCQTFTALEPTRSGSTITILVRGTAPDASSGGNITCTQQLQFVTKHYDAPGPFSGTVTVIGSNPGGTDVRKQVTVQ